TWPICSRGSATYGGNRRRPESNSKESTGYGEKKLSRYCSLTGLTVAFSSSPPVGIAGLTMMLSGFLLFQVQPMMARYILPWFGGSATTWTVCLLFFQVSLLLGY